MRIIYVTERLPYGQGEAFIYPEIEELITQGHDIHIAPVNGSLIRNRDEEVVHEAGKRLLVRTLILRPNALNLASPSFWKQRILVGGPTAKRTLQNVRSVLLGIELSETARKHEVEFIHAHWANHTATVAMTASLLSDIPWGLTAYRYDIVANNHLDAKVKHAHLARFVSQKSLQLAEATVGRKLETAVVLSVGIRVSDLDELPPTPKKPRVAVPANLIPIKGHAYVISAARILLDKGLSVEIDCMGRGPEEPALRRQIRELGLQETVRIIAPLSHEKLLATYREGRYSMMVLPSLDLGNGQHEGIPLSLCEAMAHGVPVISTATGGIPELIIEGVGTLVPPADPIALAEAIERVISHPDESRECAWNAYALVKERFNIKSTAEALTNAFEASRL